MYNIVIICGGTGSIALQNGLNKIFGKYSLNIDLIINAYDNGKSTGECRRVFNNQILGPSDLRKNHLTQFKIQYADEIKNSESIQSKMLNLFELRLSATDYTEYYEKVKNIISDSSFLDKPVQSYLIKLIDFFFFADQEKHTVRPNIKLIKFENFSLSNIFYASIAAMNNNSLSIAGEQLSKILKIKNNVHLISDINVFLSAETKSGYVISDEGDIVCWNNGDDPIIKAILRTPGGNEYIPCVDEGADLKQITVTEIISKADIIIFSSGTQWSSLIPTYMHRGFRELIEKSSARKYLIMNNTEDSDMCGVSADTICHIVNQYFDISDVKIVLNDNATKFMNKVSNKYNTIHAKLGEYGHKEHNSNDVIKLIMQDYFNDVLKFKEIMFDLDGTLWNETGDTVEKQIGKENLRLYNGMIISGNSYEHVKEIIQSYCIQGKKYILFADYGNTYFESTDYGDVQLLSRDYILPDKLVEEIRSIKEFRDKVTLRGGVILTIKPLMDRLEKVKKINRFLSKYDGKYLAKIAGNTSIDITCAEYNKAKMVELIIQKFMLDKKSVLFVGNELKEGNEVEINDIGIRTLQVDDVYECNVFLKTCILLS